MALPKVKEGQTLDMKKEKIFPIISKLFSDLSKHDTPAANRKNPELYEEDSFYLEKQNSLGCWAHVLGVILGFRLHPSIENEDWLVAFLISFFKIPAVEGLYENIEPSWLCVEEDNGLDMEQVRKELGMSEKNTYDLVTTDSTFDLGGPPPASIDKFLRALQSNFFGKGLSNLDAHFLFTSMNNCTGTTLESNPYLGAKHIGRLEILCEEEVLCAFFDNGCNYIVLSHRLLPNSQLLHYVIFWKCDTNKEIFFYDPKSPFTRNKANSKIYNGYRMPEISNQKRPLLFSGCYRCAFFFKLQQNSLGVVQPSTVEAMVANMNERIHCILKHYFQLHQFEKDTFIRLEKDFDGGRKVKWSNRKLVVCRSSLRNIKTGNSVGYGVKLKTALKKNDYIGSFIGRVVVLSAKEIADLSSSKNTTQFYMLELSLNSDVKRNYRISDGQEYIEGANYGAYLDCSEAARIGQCLISYCNSPKDTYTFNGASAPESNAMLSIAKGRLSANLYATKNMPVGTEVVWNYGAAMKLPQTPMEEQFSKLHPEDFLGEWSYPDFSRSDIISYLKCEDITPDHPRYDEALRILEEALADSFGNRTDQTHYRYFGNRTLSKKQISNHKLVPEYIPVKDIFAQINYVLFRMYIL